MKKIGIMTLGCRVNQYESQAIAEGLERLGYCIVSFSDDCDVYIINTCTVTSESDRKSKQMIGRALARKKDNSEIIVCVIGCYTQNKMQIEKNAEALFKDGIDFIGGNTDKSRLPQLLHEYISSQNNQKVNILTNIDNVGDFEDITVKKSNNVRAFLKVQDGCNNFCTYCIVPRVRGRIRSKSIENVKNDLIGLRNSGYEEVVFCGIEISSYGNDGGDSLLTLAELAQELGFKRVRFGSLNPIVFSENFTRKLSQIKVVMPHFHLSVQSASSRVLSVMGRKYDSGQLKKCVENIYKYFEHVTLSCDIICGFPGETTEDFEETAAFIKSNEIIHAHIFPYSKRLGTPAAEFPNQHTNKTKKERCAALSHIAFEKKKYIYEAQVGKKVTVLIENFKSGYWFGHTEKFLPVAIKKDCKPGEFVQVTLENNFDFISDEYCFIIE
ncbi:MAG: tRNA (N(6)-L-threonylcarbamoyladenosine(37)-C(2))-methylthiotransferase MtaB [Ruminococcaceae bacterium]|nr:tRNA (N(6)-L-threonylcarbamoyladenosine(37)-C(2))-methylthiotransferase MtaB [Oscillospiraceae bacterium]